MHRFLLTPIRDSLARRPLLVCFLSTVSWLLSLLGSGILIPVSALFLFILFLFIKRQHQLEIAACVLLFCVLVMNGHLASPIQTDKNKIYIIQGAHVLAADTDYTYAVGRLTNRQRLIVYGKAAILRPGAVIETTSSLDTPSKQRNPGGFDEMAWANSLGAGQTVRLSKYDQSSQMTDIGSRFRFAWWSARKAIFAHVSDTFSPALSGWLSAFSGGGTKSLFLHDKTILSQLSLSHLTSVSGLHVSYILMPLGATGGRERIGRRGKIVRKACLMAWIFFLADGRSGVARAVFMRQIDNWMAVKGHPPDAMESISGAGLIMLFLSPYRVLQAGFWLSIVAAISIRLLASPFLDAIKKRFPCLPMWFAQSVAVTTVAQCGVLPFLILQNELLSPVGVMANVALSFVAQCLTLLALLSVTMLPILTWIGMAAVYADLIHLPLSLAVSLLNRAISLAPSFSLYWLPGFMTVFSVLLFLLVLFLVALGLNRIRLVSKVRRPLYITLIFLILLTLILPFARPIFLPELTVWFLDVGQGDCCVLQFQDGTTWMIDGGKPDHGYQTIWPFMKAMGIPYIDLAFVTHGHQDHAGGILDLVRLGRIRQLAMPVFSTIQAENGSPDHQAQDHGGAVDDKNKQSDQVTETESAYLELDLCQELIETAGSHVPILYLNEGDALNQAGILVSVLRLGLQSSDSNEMSLQLYLSHKTVSMLFTADATPATEDGLTGLSLGPISVLKVAHHGSRFTTGKPFVERYRPSVSVISVGYNNYGHPADDCLANLASVDSLIYRTDHHGAIRLRSDGKKVDVKTWLK